MSPERTISLSLTGVFHPDEMSPIVHEIVAALRADQAAVLGLLDEQTREDIRTVVSDPGEMKNRHARRRLSDLLDGGAA